MMRVCVIGAGLAGSLLAWRLAGDPGHQHVDVVVGELDHDATEASGGLVRAYEPHPVQRRLAIDSLGELLSSRVLREWSDYRRIGSVYLRQASTGLADEVAEIDRALYGSATLCTGPDLLRAGFHGLPPGTVGIAERFAGYVSPKGLRRQALADVVGRERVAVREVRVEAVTPHADGTVECRFADGTTRRYDTVVVAAGAWTPALLRASGLSADGYRTKSIQYTIYPAGNWRPPQFVDETSGLFGRPTADGSLLLGLPTQEWGASAGPASATVALHEEALRIARARFPQLRLGPAKWRVNAADCYTEQPVLRLRPVGAAPRLYTFTGGSGGSVKTALAASRLAATHLTAL